MHKIMVIDDDLRVGEIYGGHLERAGYRVVVRNEANDSIAAVRRFQPDLILLDVELGSSNGVDILQQLRKVRRLESLPVILFTTHASPEVIRSGWKAGASRVVSKLDCDPEQMLVLVRSVLEGKAPAWKVDPSSVEEIALAPKTQAIPSRRPLRHLPGLIKAIQASEQAHTRKELLTKASQILKESLQHSTHGTENLKSLTCLFLERLEEVVPDPGKHKGFLWNTLQEAAELLDKAWASPRGTFPREIVMLDGDIFQSKAIALACMKAGLELQNWSKPSEYLSNLQDQSNPPDVFIFGLKHGLENALKWRKLHLPSDIPCVLLISAGQPGPQDEGWILQKAPFNLKEVGLRLANLATRHWRTTA